MTFGELNDRVAMIDSTKILKYLLDQSVMNKV